MNTGRIVVLKSTFDGIAHKVPDENVEYWLARELMPLLGYTRWENFFEAVKRAETACLSQNIDISFHFRDTTKMVDIGMGKMRAVSDVMLSRYACYLIAMNGDPRKEEIAFAQGYFAVQTRKQEQIEERIQYIERMIAREKLAASETQLSKNIYERGIDEDGFARIRSKGDEALFGGLRTLDMKHRLGVREYRPLADFLPTLTIAAKNLATEMTNYNVEHRDLQGEEPITGEHVTNNKTVRDMLGSRGIVPEDLPPAADIKKLERHVKSQDRRIACDESAALPRAEKGRHDGDDGGIA